MANYARVVRRSAALCSVVAVVMIAICAAIAGTKGLYGALVGVGIVTVFFGISIVAVGRAAKVSPMVMMAVAMATYIVKIIAFMIILVVLQHVTVFNAADPRLYRDCSHPRLERRAGYHHDAVKDALRDSGRGALGRWRW